MKTQTDKKVSEEAVQSLTNELESLGKERASMASNHADDQGRKTVYKEDITEVRN